MAIEHASARAAGKVDARRPGARWPDTGEPGDPTLSVLLSRGDDDATRLAWDRFSPLVRRILRRGLGPNHDVEDVLQEVFLRFYRRVPELRDGAALRSFVIAITVNALRSELRRMRVRRIVRLVDPVELPELRSVDTDPEARVALRAFYRVLDRMRDRERVVFVLHVIEGLSAAEVAQALEISLPTVRRRLARARTRIDVLSAREPLLTRYRERAAGDAP